MPFVLIVAVAVLTGNSLVCNDSCVCDWYPGSCSSPSMYVYGVVAICPTVQLIHVLAGQLASGQINNGASHAGLVRFSTVPVGLHCPVRHPRRPFAGQNMNVALSCLQVSISEFHYERGPRCVQCSDRPAPARLERESAVRLRSRHLSIQHATDKPVRL